MVTTVINESLGLFNSQSTGVASQGSLGQGNEQFYVNALNGNLIVQRQDQVLINQGIDNAIVRTYNSQGNFSNNVGGGFRFSFNQRLSVTKGSVNENNSEVTLIRNDGSETIFVYKNGTYMSTDGAGAHDTLTYQASYWTLTEGSSQYRQVFRSINSQFRLVAHFDNESNASAFVYENDKVKHIVDNAEVQDNGLPI